MIAVVTGSSGFIGSHLVDALLARGATVRVIVRPASPPARQTDHVSRWTMNLLDAAAVKASTAWDGATHVFHVGGMTKGRTLAQFRDGNVVPAANILAALAARGTSLDRFVLVSSQAAAGPAASGDRPVREDDPPAPIEAYGRSKLEAETVAARYAASLPVTIVRPGAVYGPRDVDFLKVFRQAVGRVAVFAAPAEQLLSVVFVRDLVAALLLVAESDRSVGRRYFVAADERVTWRTLYRTISALAGTKPFDVQIPGALLTLAGLGGSAFSLVTGRQVLVNTNKVALGRPPWWLCDPARIREELGWKSQTNLQEGLRETYLWYVRAGWLQPGRLQEVGDRSKLEERV